MPWGATSSKSRCIEPSLPTSPQLPLNFDPTFIQSQPNNQKNPFISFQTIFHNWFQLQLNCHSSSTHQSQLSFHPISTPTQPELSLNLNLNPYHANSFQERRGPLKEHQDQLPGHSDSLPNDPKSLPELQYMFSKRVFCVVFIGNVCRLTLTLFLSLYPRKMGLSKPLPTLISSQISVGKGFESPII